MLSKILVYSKAWKLHPPGWDNFTLLEIMKIVILAGDQSENRFIFRYQGRFFSMTHKYD